MNYGPIIAVVVAFVLVVWIIYFMESKKGPKGDTGERGMDGERGLSAKEIVQRTLPEIVTDEDFIAFLKNEFKPPKKYHFNETLVEKERGVRDVELDFTDVPRPTSQPHGDGLTHYWGTDTHGEKK
jgi:hypothetical protein